MSSPPLLPPVVGPRLRRLLLVLLVLFALLVCNACYLGAVTLAEYLSGETYQNLTYQYMFLIHLGLGVLIIVPLIVYGTLHIKNAHRRPNRRAVQVGYALFVTALSLLISGLFLTRGIAWLELNSPQLRLWVYWLHVVAPLVAVWLFVLHRLAGKPINWRLGLTMAGIAMVVAGLGLVALLADPRAWGRAGPASGERYFFPSLARTASGEFIPAPRLMSDEYCAECHADIHAAWSVSAHRFASFNNPAYLFSVRRTREKMLARDGRINGARFCAGCHDPVPFFSGAFDDPQFDDISDPTAQAGITCVGCHAITHVNSVRGNADYTIEDPLYYPFTFSQSTFLSWLNRTLVKAKPAFHKKTFLKPLHRQAEFCGTCHKVHLPPELNAYRWLRGQNHYDSYHLSGVSGHGVSSFYYPERAEPNCNGCHMVPRPSEDFAAVKTADGRRVVHDHQFPAANTALPHLLGLGPSAMQRQHEFLRDTVSVDIFGVREGAAIDGELHAPLPMADLVLQTGREYLLEVVLRTRTLGHLFTEGTADSNQVWLEVEVTDGDGRVLAQSGQRNDDGIVDPWAHFVNAWVIDRQGRRIDARQAEDIFTKLYSNQIPPGAADAVHYRLRLPTQVATPIAVSVRLLYRKFDSTYMRAFQGDAYDGNDLPVVTISSDQVHLSVAAKTTLPSTMPRAEAWMRWNDYGIGLLRKAGPGQLRQAEAAFRRVAELGRVDGQINLARVYLREGRLEHAQGVLTEAAQSAQLTTPWLVTWLSAQVDFANGRLPEAVAALRELVATPYPQARQRGFDFAQDYRLLERLAQALFELAKSQRADAHRYQELLQQAAQWYGRALALEPERASSHYGLAQVLAAQGRTARAQQALRAHARYKVDDNARDVAVAAARRSDPVADHAAEAVVIYDLKASEW